MEEVISKEIQMNQPLKFDKYTLYQAGYQQEYSKMSFNVFDIDDPEQSIDTFTVDLANPEDMYELNDGYTVEIIEYFPDYYIEDGAPRSESKYPRNPAFVFKLSTPDQANDEVSFIGIGQNIPGDEDHQYQFGFAG